MYQIKFFRDVKKQLKRFPSKDQERIGSHIRLLADDPRPSGCVHLRDVLYRIRVGEYRVLYAVFDKALVVIVVKASRRSETTYQDLLSLIDRAQRMLGSR